MRQNGLRKVPVIIVLLGVMLAKIAPAAPPVVPGFARFANNATVSPSVGGQLLLGELNCASCHTLPATLSDAVKTKSAPILDQVGARLQVDFFRRFLTDPAATKPGTTMPHLLAHFTDVERKVVVEALTHFLAAQGGEKYWASVPHRMGAANGETLYHQIGCIACHDTRKPGANKLPFSVPLADLATKYTVESLRQFLLDPLKTRPSGRMPKLNLTEAEANDLVGYFLRDVQVPANLDYQYYEGHWDKLPDFSKLKPKREGASAGFDLSSAERTSEFGLVFRGFVRIDRAGTYTFHLGSDDGSKLYINDVLIADSDGIHPTTYSNGRTQLAVGLHPVRMEYFNAHGEWTLFVDIEGQGLKRTPLAGLMRRTRDGKPLDSFTPSADLVKRGKELFTRFGCANCHSLKENNRKLTSTLKAPVLGPLRLERGCLGSPVAERAPRYLLDDSQRAALQATLRQPTTTVQASKTPSASENSLARVAAIHATLVAHNCYACHQRGSMGGVIKERDSFFTTTMPEMGDEGRIPPTLTGVGDKLSAAYLRDLFHQGGAARPYMRVRMPTFGGDNVGHLLEHFEAVDLPATKVTAPKIDEALHRVKAKGRFMVGDKAFSCIKCHYFGEHKATGIQAMDLTRMAYRLKPDWFYRYMRDPQEYRPGTRMPTSWPKNRNKSLLFSVYEGDIPQQLTAVWTYLQDGANAGLPDGLVQGRIEIKPGNEPVIYRNFIQGAGPRAIGVGYPEKVNLAFDANELRLAMVWQNGFIDGSRHWNGRGVGFEAPLGDSVLTLHEHRPFARLDSANSPWPTDSVRGGIGKFRGYRFDAQRRPVFLYEVDGVQIEDHFTPYASEFGYFERTLTLRGAAPSLYYRAAVGNTIKPQGNNSFQVENSHQVVLEAGATTPVLRTLGGKTELLMPVVWKDGKATIRQTLRW